jgi:hypothetical protein
MSILFDKRGKKAIKVMFSIVGVLVVISMIMLYGQGIFTAI